MQAIILAAGKSTRTYPLTLEKPKPLLKVAGKTILEHNLDALAKIKPVDEIILVVGYKKGMIKNRIGNKYKNLKIRYVEQKEQLGTGHALMIASPYIKGRFILLMGDNIYFPVDIKKCIENKNSILTMDVKDPENYGVVLEKDGFVYNIIEKPKNFIANTVNTALYVFDKSVLSYLSKIKKTTRNEIEITDVIKLFSRAEKIKCVKSKAWIPIVYPKDILNADLALRKGKNIIGVNAKLSGKVINSSIGAGCLVEGVVKDSIVMDHTRILENSEIYNSIIGEHSIFSGTAKDAVIGDNVRAKNINIVSCSIWGNKRISGQTVSKDVK